MVSFDPDVPSFLEGIPYPAMILDDSSRIITMNRLMEAVSGHAAHEVYGVHGELVVRSNTGNTRGQHFLKVLQTGEPLSVEGDMINCYRHKIPIHYHIAAVKDKRAKRPGLLVIAEEISTKGAQDVTGPAGFNSADFIGHSPKMQKVFDMIPLMAHTDASVLITGETGTGKDKIAEIIHKESSRSRYPFIKINCGALPLGLLESELFGHVKGAFTGATRNKPGMFKLADRGTLFLTEIGDMPMPLQVKLLSVLDDRQFVPVGGEHKESVDVRIIAATHRPLREQVKRNKFREDLFYRLNVLHVHLPPLRERESDVRYLLEHFLEKFTGALGKSINGFTPSAIECLMTYRYPGNVRELSNIVEYAVNICKRKKISKEQLPPYLFERQEIAQQGPDTKPSEHMEPSLRAPSATGEVTAPNNAPHDSWGDIERQMIVESLKEHHGNRTQTAASLGWGRMKLWRKMKKYGLLE